MLEKVCADFPNVTVAGFEGLLTDVLRRSTTSARS